MTRREASTLTAAAASAKAVAVPKRRELFALAYRMKTPVWVFDIDACRVIHANDAACALWRADSEAALRNRDMAEDMSAAVARRLRQYQSDFTERDAIFTEMWTLYPHGAPTNVMVNFRGVRLDDGRMAMMCEAYGHAETQPDNIRSVEALLLTDVFIGLYDLSGVPLYLNPAARSQSPNGDAPLFGLFVERADYDRLMFDLDGANEVRQVARIVTAQGERWFDINAKFCSDAVSGDPAILVTAVDVSDLKNAEDRARFLASSDQLTGCFNRSYLTHVADRIRRIGSDSVAVLYFDIDRFKHINDTFGHDMGDRVLVELANKARAQCRDGDTIVRLGGDEFVVVLECGANQPRLHKRIAALFEGLCTPVTSGQVSIDVKVSMGVTIVRDRAGFDIDRALSEADIALYASKNNGRNQCTFFDAEMGAAARNRTRTEADIARALDRREFTLHYQPRLDLRTGRIVSVEGLARWHHPDRGLLLPADFIPICEETGMIEALGEQVLEMGFAQARRWRANGQDMALSLNVSPRQFADPEMLPRLEDLARAADLPPGAVELEVTESVLFGELDKIAAKLCKLTEMGFDIAIDDFGTGYSNLSYISLFPLTCLKIDRSFVNQLPESGPIVELILALAKKIGATAVAEGVETKAQFDWLRTHGCDQIQGFYLSGAVAPDALGALLQDPFGEKTRDPGR